MPWSAPSLKPQKRRYSGSVWRSDPFYRSSKWQKFRKWFLSRHPLCADPFGYHAQDGEVVAAVDVDHIVMLRDRRDLALVESNCQGLCKQCHGQKTALENRRKQAPSKKGGGVPGSE